MSILSRGNVRDSAVSRPTRLDDRWFGRAIATPMVAFALALVVVPFVYSLWTAFVEFNLRSTHHPFVGFDNFAAVLSDPVFRRALIFTFGFAAVATSIELLLGFVLALSLYERPAWVRRLVLPLVILPIFIPAIAVGQIWRLWVSRSFGPFNYLVSLIPGVTVDIDWLINRPLNVLALLAADAWQWTALPFLLTYAALEAIDRSVVDAANIDGANSWQRAIHVILPLLAPTMAAAAFFRFSDALRTYETILIMTSGGPGRSTSTITFYLIETGFGGSFNLAHAAAASWVLTLLVAILLYRFVRSWAVGSTR